MNKLYVVTIDFGWIRDGQLFETKGLSNEEIAEADLIRTKEAYDDRWKDYETSDYLGCVWAADADEAIRKIASIQKRDPRQLSAYAAEDEASCTEHRAQESMIFMVTDEEKMRRYPVAGFAYQSLEMVWNSQKCWFSDGASITISAPDGRKQTFHK